MKVAEGTDDRISSCWGECVRIAGVENDFTKSMSMKMMTLFLTGWVTLLFKLLSLKWHWYQHQMAVLAKLVGAVLYMCNMRQMGNEIILDQAEISCCKLSKRDMQHFAN